MLINLDKRATLSDQEKLEILLLKPAILRLFTEWEKDFITRILTFEEKIEGINVHIHDRRKTYQDTKEITIFLEGFLAEAAYEKTLLSPSRAIALMADQILEVNPHMKTKADAIKQAEQLIEPYLATPPPNKFSLVFTSPAHHFKQTQE